MAFQMVVGSDGNQSDCYDGNQSQISRKHACSILFKDPLFYKKM